MALQSQTLRGNSVPRTSIALSKARKRSPAKLIGAAAVLALVGGGAVYLLRTHAPTNLGPQSAKADVPTPPATPTPAPAVETPAPVTASAPVETKPSYDVLEMAPRPRVGGTPTSATKPDTLASPRPNYAADQPTGAGMGPGMTATPAAAVTTTPMPTEAAKAPSAGAASVASTSPAVRDPLAANPAGAPAGTPGAPAGATPFPPAGLPAELGAIEQLADRALADKKPLEARTHLNKILTDARVSEAHRETLRRKLTDLNKDLLFSATSCPGDPMVAGYTVEKGDNIIKISRKLNTVTEAGLIQRVNAVNPSALRVGQPLKIVRGPFHAVVSKSAFRMDVYWGPSVSPSAIGTSGLGAGAEPGWVYIRSFPVGLGEKGTTPLGTFTLKERSKLINPPWINPRTGEKFDKDDPKNPIGERWMGLVGLDDKSKAFSSYGIHGTVVPESIGQEMSMGCVRMKAEDVEIVYELLMERVSIVKIVP